MIVSVAMTTYRSKAYIKDQLESIWRQTRLPDELCICDDCSPDDTYEYVQLLIKDAPSSIKTLCVRNSHNIGYLKNFEKVFDMCSGDIIFASDSDDVWDDSKIETMAGALEKNPNIVLGFHDAIVIDKNGQMMYESLNKRWDHRKNKQSAEELSILSAQRKGCAYGMSMCFRKEYYTQAKPFTYNYGHDEWLCLLASCFGDVYCSNEKLVLYRRHDTNTSGHSGSIFQRMRSYDRDRWFTHPADIMNVYKEFLTRYEPLASRELIYIANDQILFQSVLKDIVCNDSFGWIKLLIQFFKGRYGRYRGTWKTLLLDELYIILHIWDKK